jgi:hypothetical protein
VADRCYISAMRPQLHQRVSRLLATGTLFLAFAGSASAESALRLPYPANFGSIPASTYDTEHNRVGDAHLVIETLEGDRVRLVVESGIEGGARTVATAEFEAIENRRFLRLLKEESRSIDEKGVPLGVLSIDHENGVASCEKAGGGDMESQKLTLPPQDRVANVPLNLLFQPLIDGSTETLSFQVLLCRFGARLIDIDARVVEPDDDNDASPFIEVEYQPNFGRFVSLVASNVLPKLSIWFDPRSSSPWIAHRVPLYSKGPEVIVVRDEVAKDWLSRQN